MIRFVERKSDKVTVVYLDNRKVGEIRNVDGGYRYVSKKSKKMGAPYASVEAVKHAIGESIVINS